MQGVYIKIPMGTIHMITGFGASPKRFGLDRHDLEQLAASGRALLAGNIKMT